MLQYTIRDVAEEIDGLLERHETILKEEHVYSDLNKLLYKTQKCMNSLSPFPIIKWLKRTDEKLENIHEKLDESANQNMQMEEESPHIVPKEITKKQDERIDICHELEELHDHVLHTL